MSLCRAGSARGRAAARRLRGLRGPRSSPRRPCPADQPRGTGTAPSDLPTPHTHPVAPALGRWLNRGKTSKIIYVTARIFSTSAVRDGATDEQGLDSRTRRRFTPGPVGIGGAPPGPPDLPPPAPGPPPHRPRSPPAPPPPPPPPPPASPPPRPPPSSL